MKFIAIIIPFFVLYPPLLFGQVVFQNYYNGNFETTGHSLVSLPDGSIVIAGFRNPGFFGGADFVLMKVDSDGNQIWSKSYGNPAQDDIARDLLLMDDGGFVLVGSGESKVFIVRTDSNGDTLWTKHYNENSVSDGAMSVDHTQDGGLIIAGGTFTPNNDNDVYLLKTDANGDTLWTRTFGGAGKDLAFCVKELSDGSYIICGKYTVNFNYDIYLLRVDASGNLMWENWLGGASYDIAIDITVLPDDSFTLAANTGSYGAGNWDNYIVHCDEFGDTIWTTVIGNQYENSLTSIKQDKNGGYLLAGSTVVISSNSYYDANILNVDINGNLNWNKTISHSTPETSIYVYDIIQNEDGYYLTGASSGLMLMKLDSSLMYLGGIEPNEPFLLKVYPNPAVDFFTIEHDFTGQVDVQLLDVAGRLVERYDNIAHKQIISLNKNQIKNGVYILNILNKENLLGTKKIIVNR